MNPQRSTVLLVCLLFGSVACGDADPKTSTNNVNNTSTNNTSTNNTSTNNTSTNNSNPSEACDPPSELEEVEHELWSNDECVVPSGSLNPRTYTSMEEFFEDIDCLETADPNIDFTTHRLAFVVASSNPDIELRGVVEDETGAIKIYTASPAYCGGAAPPDSGLYVLVPLDEREIVHSHCGYGECNFENNNLPPGSR